MSATRRLLETLKGSEYLSFYHLMKYPVPRQREWFIDEKISSSKKNNGNVDRDFSRDQENNLLAAYLAEVENHGAVYQSIPFVEEIFLCNSLTFNALHKGSDIDFFVITRPGRIWTAKFFTMLKAFSAGIKRFRSKKEKKICLSFFVSSDHQNLYSISVKGVDIYLCYWIAHLVPLYQSDPMRPFQIREKNKRIQGILPNFPLQQSIFLGNPIFSGDSGSKKTLEKILGGTVGDIVELVLKIIQSVIIFFKKICNPQQNKDVITTNQMLKFHQDIREKVSLKYSIMKKRTSYVR